MEKDASEITKLTERILKDPKSKLFVPLAEEYKKIGQIDMAVSVLTEGLKNNPGYATARSFLGRILLDQGNLSAAQKEFEEVVKTIPDNLLAQRKLGDICILLGKTDDALGKYKTALALSPSDKELASIVADLEAGKDVSGRIPKPKTSAPAEPKKPEPVKKPAEQPSAGPQQPPVHAARTSVAATPVVATPVAPVIPSPAVQKDTPAPSSAPKPVAAVPETTETIEEIVEIETLELPVEKQIPPKLSPIGPAETVPPLKSPEVEQPGVGAFDLSEAAVVTSMHETPPAVSWEPAGIVDVEPEVTPPAAKAEDDINTDTLAELYIAQGFYDKAIEIYQRMLTERPDNTALQNKLLKLHALAGAPQPLSAPMSPPPRIPVAPSKSELKGRQEIEGSEAATGPGAAGSGTLSTGPEHVEAEPPVPPQREAKTAAVREVSPAADVVKETGGDPAGKVAGGPAAVRRKETIDRLESWLKNVIKEKPE